MKRRVIIMGAAGRDFHNFNTFFRDNEAYEVVAFTATQIPNIEGRKYPSELAGRLYPNGIPINAESELPALVKDLHADEVVLAYSDLPNEYVMHKASIVNAAGADFKLMGTAETMLKSSKPVIAVCAVRTGCGKSQTTRRVCEELKAKGRKVAVVRHPMPYGDLVKQRVQRFASYEDLDTHDCTIEEREEYEPHIDRGNVVFAGVDYEAILREAEKEADVIVWDGGNNDFSFYAADKYITVADPHRPGHELGYYPGETNTRLADVVVINKVDTADPRNVETVKENVRSVNPDVIIITAKSPPKVSDPSAIKGKRVLVVEDGPTTTHGGMPYGVAFIAAEEFGAAEIVDPRPVAFGSIKKTFEKFPHLEKILPAMGYGTTQVKELEATINAVDCDVVLAGTPIDLNRVIRVNKPVLRVGYDLEEVGNPTIKDVLEDF
ncbi:MAG: GTPase [Candidatus Diapherotrites archaeon]|nr:GTPase [Candidatus Diapherotrites archaeon]